MQYNLLDALRLILLWSFAIGLGYLIGRVVFGYMFKRKEEVEEVMVQEVKPINKQISLDYPIKFDDIKDELFKIIKSIPKKFFPEEERFELVDGFVGFPIRQELSESILLSSSSIPSIAIVGFPSGRLYFLALRVLMPNLNI